MSNTQKRYALFAGITYYPSGGWDDFVGAFESVEAAEADAEAHRDEIDWYQVADLSTYALVIDARWGDDGAKKYILRPAP